jgi:hypothetical protein
MHGMTLVMALRAEKQELELEKAKNNAPRT